MRKLEFTKMVASGNDFVVVERNYLGLAKHICDRKYGAGADGLLVLEKSKIADVKMRIFNADGSEAQMCGNGARCVALYISPQSIVHSPQKKVKIETKAGIIESQMNKDKVKIKLTEPKNIKLDIPLKIGSRTLRVNFINTGVPHTVIFVEGLEKIDVSGLGPQIRYHRQFAPQGANVNFVEVLNRHEIKVRTYERGVEDETLACGTGAVASALILNPYYLLLTTGKVNVRTKGGEVLKVYFKYEQGKFRDVWLEGKARIVYKGEYYV